MATGSSTDDFTRFDQLVRKVFSVPHSEIMRREAEYQKTRPGLRGKKRGRKPKVNPSASGHAVES